MGRGPATEGSIRVEDPIVLRDETGAEAIGTLRHGDRDSAVVVVHGIVGSRRLPEIEEVARALARDHDTLALDVRGHGDAPGRFTWGREEWRQVSAAEGFLRRRRRAVHAVGFSFGGYHAVKAAARGAGFDRLVLVGAPVDLRVHDHFLLGRSFWRHLPPMLRRRRRVPRLAWPSALGDRALTDEDLARVPSSTLVIHGGDDWLVSRRHAERYARGIPAARLVDIPGGFHAEYLVHSSRDALLEALRRFLA